MIGFYIKIPCVKFTRKPSKIRHALLTKLILFHEICVLVFAFHFANYYQVTIHVKLKNIMEQKQEMAKSQPVI